MKPFTYERARSAAQAAVGQLLDVRQGQVADVDDQPGLDDAQLHMVDEVGATREEDGVGAVGDRGDGVGDAGGAVVVEGDHCAAWRMAATMFG